MTKKLVAYFSASGVTAHVAKELAAVESADLFEIKPETPYTKEDLDWTNKQSRSTLEMNDPNCRPALACTADVSAYDTVFVGFPIWWGREPSVVDTFLDSADFSGKKIVPFCTSGGGGAEGAAKRIAELTGAEAAEGKRLGGDVSEEDLKIWTAGLNI